jgi:DNA polymerase-3 subunit alpha
MDHGMSEQKRVNEEVLKISQKTGIPLVATNDVHYPNRDDSEAHDIFLCIGSGKKKTDTKRQRYASDQFYFKTYEEMKSSLGHLSQEALTNTGRIADMCHYYPDLDQFNLPQYELPENHTSESYLKELCTTQLISKVPEASQKEQERLEYELNVINTMGFSSYFLIVQDFINAARKMGVSVGPGRGSAAGSLVSYVLGITELNPLNYDLLFERFLNPGRVEMPDIDTDFDDWGRDRVIEYVRQKYGEDRVAQIITFGRLKSRAVIRDVGRVLDIPLSDVDIIAKMIPQNTGLTEALKESPELKAKIESSELYHELWRNSLRLEELVRHPSIHAAGIIIGKEPLKSTVPLYRDPRTKAVTTQFEGKYLEKYGLLKMDFLGLRNLRILNHALIQVEKKTKEKINLLSLPLDDADTYKLLQEGKGIGVFQCESEGMRELMKRLSPTRFEDIIALIALYRPGPLNSGMTEDFVKRKKNPKLIEYPHPDLEPVLEDTYGVIVYQEQVMLIAQIIGGFSLAEADNLRKAMGKKIKEKMAEMGEKFVNGAIEKGYKKKFAEKIYDQMAKFAEYGFNKSHSAAYAFIAYHTAYMKSHYPVEYMTAVLNAEKNKIESLVKYLKECKEMGIEIYPPDVNRSHVDFEVEGQGIRFGLSAIKNVGEANIRAIIEERYENGEYSSFQDLVSRVDLNKKVLENLALSGTLDKLIPSRASIIHNVEKIIQFASLKKKDRNSGMVGLFDSIEEESFEAGELQLETVEEFKENELLKMEKQNLGLYITGHPLGKCEEKIQAYSTKTTGEIKEIKGFMDQGDITGTEVPDRVEIAGIFISVEFKKTKKNDNMAICLLEDLDSEIKVVVFPKAFEKFADKLNAEEPLLVKGKIDFNGKEAQILADEIELLKDLPDIVKTSIVNIKLEEREVKHDNLNYLKQILKGNPGHNPVIFHLYDLEQGRKVNIRAGREYFITVNEAILEKIRKISCVEDIWVNGH